MGVYPLQLVNLYRNRRYFVIKLHTWFCLIFLEDKHNILLHLSIFYEYQQFFQHRICFQITNETSHVTTHAIHSDPWPTLARSTRLFLICCYNNVGWCCLLHYYLRFMYTTYHCSTIIYWAFPVTTNYI